MVIYGQPYLLRYFYTLTCLVKRGIHYYILHRFEGYFQYFTIIEDIQPTFSITMSLPLLFGSSPPLHYNNYYGVEQLSSLDLDEAITQEEVDEDIEDEKVRIDQAFYYMKEEVQKEMEGALAPKTVSDYARYVVVCNSLLNLSLFTSI